MKGVSVTVQGGKGLLRGKDTNGGVKFETLKEKNSIKSFFDFGITNLYFQKVLNLLAASCPKLNLHNVLNLYTKS